MIKYQSKYLNSIYKKSFQYSLRSFNTSNFSNEDVLQILKSKHPNNNIPDSILNKVGENLHLKSNHPLCIIKKKY